MRKLNVKLTKIAVAQRQIDAAIMMFFIKMDELAIHSVAGAATKLLQELNRSRGSDPVRRALEVGTLRAIHEHLNGNSINSEITKFLNELVAQLTPEQMILLKSQNYQNSPIRLVGDTGAYWSKLLKPVNFLKHSSKDQDKLLELSEIDNVELIVHVIASYIELGLPPTPSMTIFTCYWISRQKGTLPPIPNELKVFTNVLLKLSESQAKKFSVKLIKAKP